MAIKKQAPDKILFFIILAIIILGLFVFASASSVLSKSYTGSSYYFFLQQLLGGFLPGIIIAFFLFKFPLQKLRKWAPMLLIINLFLLALIFVPFLGETSGGATRWLSLRSFGVDFSFQPAELLKLTFILYLASWLTTRTGKKSKKNTLLSGTFLPFIVVSGVISVILYLQPDISTLVVILFTALTMYFLARTPLWHTIAFIMGGLATIWAVIKLAPYRMARIEGMLNPDMDPLGTTYQAKQMLITIGSGGITGLGLGMSRQKYGFLPQSMDDSIFAIMAEEMGLIGGVILILLFLAFLWRGFLIAQNNKDQFIRLAVIGISTWIFIQAFVNIGAMIGVIPLTGIPLPFISYGKSHIIAEMAAIGILFNASKQYEKK